MSVMAEDSLCDNGNETSKENPFADRSKTFFFFFFLRTLTDYFFPYRFYLCYPFLPIGSHGIPLELGAHCEGANQIIDFQWVCSLTLSCALN